MRNVRNRTFYDQPEAGGLIHKTSALNEIINGKKKRAKK